MFNTVTFLNFNIYTLLALIIGYLFGSISFALVIGKVFYKTDIREYGSGNLGGTNAGRVLGKKAGLAVIALDVSKAIIAMTIMYFIDPTSIMYAGFAACVGHCYPIFAKFKGGKAVSTIAGYVLALIIFGYVPFYNALIPLLLFFIILKITKYVSLSSIVMIATATIMTFFTSNLEVAVSLLLLLCFTTYRHRANIKRIKDGTESKVKWL